MSKARQRSAEIAQSALNLVVAAADNNNVPSIGSVVGIVTSNEYVTETKMADTIQNKLSRVRPPRVQISYDVEIGGASEKKELPFVIGMMADLSGKPAVNLPRVADRKFIGVDRDNFDEVLAASHPRLAYRVPNRLQPDAKDNINVELRFEKFEDFEPENVVAQIPALSKLFEARQRLRDLLTKLDGNDRLDALLGEIVSNTEQQTALRDQLNAEAPAGPAPKANDEKS